MRVTKPLLTALLAVWTLSATAADAPDDPALLPAEIMPLASRSLLLDVVQTPAGLFAVGERGTILRRADDGQWNQLPVPTRTALTAITAADGELWAAGHGGVILHSGDNGDTWQRQRSDVWDPQKADPTQGVPLLDILFLDARTGFAIGAFSQVLRTDDGGQTWNAISLQGAVADEAPTESDTGPVANDAGVFEAADLVLEQEASPHLNAITRDAAGVLYIAGERGAMFRSRDGGNSWERLAFPYNGSLFGLLSFDANHVLAYGLRGSVLESTDGGDSWSQLDTGTLAALMGGAVLPGGGAVLVGSEGVVVKRSDAASAFVTSNFENDRGETPVLSGVIPQGDGSLVLIGDKGVDLYGSR